jgi:sugar/nucleoside kinase (ribokinase family)
VGNDPLGEEIRTHLVETAKRSGVNERVLDFCSPEPAADFFDPHISTPTSTIVVDGSNRTVLAQELRNGERFIEHLEARASQLEAVVPEGLDAIMLSHLQSDGRHINPEQPGRCTAYVLERFGSKATTFVNFGISQIELGFEFWKKQGVFEHIDVLQLNLTEAKRFFSDNYDQRRPLPSIVDKLRREQITAIITLDRFGALGVHRALTDSVIIAWPALEMADVKDSTGAGDAFAAGVMSYLCEHKRVTPGAFQTAIEVGRIWAAQACSTEGAAGECPDQVGLYEYAHSLPDDGRKATEVRTPHHAREIMSLLDIAFQ